LIAIVANANAHFYAREAQVLGVTVEWSFWKNKHRTYIKTWKWRCWTTLTTYCGLNSNCGRDFIAVG